MSVSDDAILVIPELYRALSDTITLVDSSTLVLPELYRSLADSLTVSDDETVLISGADLLEKAI